MPLPVFSAAGAFVGNGSPSWPTHVAGDFGLVMVEYDPSVDTPSLATGYARVPGFPIGNLTPTTGLDLQYKFATSSSEAAPSVGTPNDHFVAVIATFQNVNTSNPVNAQGTHFVRTTSSDHYCPGIQTYLADCLILAIFGRHLDNNTALSSGEENADLTSVVERIDGGDTTGNGGGVVLIEGVKTLAGLFGPTSITVSAGFGGVLACIALQSSTQGFGQRSRIVNSRKGNDPMLVKTGATQTVYAAFYDSADGKTGKTGLTPAWTLCKEGESSLSSISPTTTEIGNGIYKAALTGTHMNTAGLSTLRGTATGADPVDIPNCTDCIGIDKADSVRGGLTALPNAAAEAAGGLPTAGTGTNQISLSGGRAKADTVYWNGSAVSVPTNAGVPNVNAKTWNDLATVDLPLAPTTAGRKLDVASTGEAGLDFDNIKDATGAHTLTNIRVPNVTLTDTVTTYTGNTPQTGDAFARLGAPAGASLAADIAAIFARIGAPSGASIEADIAAIFARVGAPAGASLAADVAAAYARLGAPAGASVSADIAAVKGDTAAVKAKTDNLPPDPADQSLIIAATDAIMGRIGAPVGASISADIAADKAVDDAIKAKTDQLTFTVPNQVDANALTGGGGGGAAGYGEQRIEQDQSQLIHFTLFDSDGERATGAAAAIVATISLNGGSPTAAAGTFTEIDAVDQPGEYYYTPDTGEDSDIGTLVLYLTPDDFDFMPTSVMARVTGPQTVDLTEVTDELDDIQAEVLAIGGGRGLNFGDCE